VSTVFNVNFSYQRRSGYFNRHNYIVGITYQKVSDSILLPKYNPNFFNNGKANATIFYIGYSWNYDNVDNVAYALKGKRISINVQKNGLGFTGGTNALIAEARLNLFTPLGKNWYASNVIATKINLPFKTAYVNQRGLGYSDNLLRGMEYLVIDGVAYGLLRNTLKYKVVHFKLPMPVKIKAVPYLPFTIFAKTYADFGYVYNTPSISNRLNNKFLYSGGFGIDVLAIYDLNLRFEFSFNQLGKKDLFLHSKGGY
jgi:outer membrane protein assembly factor BamA